MTNPPNLGDIKKALLEPTKAKPINMGIGPIGDSNIVFVRQFRWTLEAESLDGTESLPSYFQKSVKVDLYKNTLHIKAYEVAVKDNILVWADAVQKDPEKNRWMVLTTYDGCGYPIYRYQFNKLYIVERDVDFNYDSSEVATHCISVAFENFTREFLYEPPQDNYEEVSTVWQASFAGTTRSSVNVPVKLDDRPKIEIEEQEINFLSAKTWIPGKSTWLPLKISVAHKDSKRFLALLTDEGYDKLILSLYRGGFKADELKESWVLSNPTITKVDAEADDECYIGISFSNAVIQTKPKK